MVFKCKKCNLVWYYPIKKCIYCRGELVELKEEKFTVKGITNVLVASKDHPQVPYYDLLLEDENGNFHLKKSFKKYGIGNTLAVDKKIEGFKEKIGVIGTGIMGTGIVQVFAAAGFEVIFKSRTKESLDKALQKIETEFSKNMTPAEKDEMIKNIKPTIQLKDLINADIVIESVIEEIETKKQLLRELDKIFSPQTIIATNTSSFSIDELASVISRPERFIGMHFFNPVSKMNLVEIIQGKKTSETAVNKIKEITKQLNKTPVITKDSPAFIVNRILMAYLNEAVWELFEGVALPTEIDTAIKLGLNHPMGPLALADLIGLDVVLAIMRNLYQRTKDKKYLPCPLLEKMVNNNKLGRKTKEGFYKY